MTDMETSLLLLIVWPSILNPVMHFSTQLLTGEMKCPTNIHLLCIFHSISFDVDAIHAPTNHQIIWSTLYHHVTVLVHRAWLYLLFTVASVHRRQVISQLALHTYNQSVEPSLILIFSTLIAWLNVMSYMQWAPSSHVWALQHLQAIFTSMTYVAHTHIPVD